MNQKYAFKWIQEQKFLRDIKHLSKDRFLLLAEHEEEKAVAADDFINNNLESKELN